MCRLVVLLFLVDLTILNGAAIKENTFFDALEKNCPYIEKIHDDFKAQDVFKKCTDWNKINATEKLSKDNENDFLCLLYFDSYTLFCSDLRRQVNMTQKQIILPRANFIPTLQILSKYRKVDDICKNLTLFPPNKKFEHNVTEMLDNDIDCVKLCSTYDGPPVPECSLAHHFANLDVVQLIAGNEVVEPKDVSNKSIDEPKGSLVQNVSANVQHDLLPSVVEDKTLQKKVGNQPGQVSASNQVVSDLAKPGESKVGVQNESGKGEQPSKIVAAVPVIAQEPPKAALPIKPAPVLVPQPVSIPSPAQNAPVIGEVIAAHPQAPHPEATYPEVSKQDNMEDSAKEQKEGGGAGGGPSKPVQVDENAKQPKVELDISNKGEAEIDVEHPESVLPNPDFEADPEEMMQPDQDDLGDDDDEDQDEKKDDQEAEKGEPKKDKQVTKLQVDSAQDADKEDSNMLEAMPGDMPINSANTVDIDGESYFFSYFMVVCVLFVLGYVGYHNRQKVMAIVVEGKRGKRQFRGRRPNSANYHKLDSNLEEAISSTCTKNASHVIY